MALHSLYCADVPLRNCSLTHSLTTKKRWYITLRRRWCTYWSIWRVGTFCCHHIRQQPETVCVLSETIWQRSIIIHLSAAAARSVDYSASFY